MFFFSLQILNFLSHNKALQYNNIQFLNDIPVYIHNHRSFHLIFRKLLSLLRSFARDFTFYFIYFQYGLKRTEHRRKKKKLCLHSTRLCFFFLPWLQASIYGKSLRAHVSCNFSSIYIFFLCHFMFFSHFSGN